MKWRVEWMWCWVRWTISRGTYVFFISRIHTHSHLFNKLDILKTTFIDIKKSQCQCTLHPKFSKVRAFDQKSEIERESRDFQKNSKKKVTSLFLFLIQHRSHFQQWLKSLITKKRERERFASKHIYQRFLVENMLGGSTIEIQASSDSSFSDPTFSNVDSENVEFCLRLQDGSGKIARYVSRSKFTFSLTHHHHHH